MLMKAYHEERGEGQQRNEVIIPDAAHGTNPFRPPRVAIA